MADQFGQSFNDASQTFGNDISFSATEDVLLTSGLELSQQRVLRRLLTNPGDYIFHVDYGAGLPLYVGQPLSSTQFNDLESAIIAQMFLEPTVSQIPTPVITIQPVQFGLFIQINYTVSPLQQPVVLTFTVSL